MLSIFLSALIASTTVPDTTLLSGNPALQVTRIGANHTEVLLTTGYARADKPLLFQLGDGHQTISFEALSRMHLADSTVVWGEASYMTGKKLDVTWNSTADYELLYPYVMGDTLGGNLSCERYAFSGGWARQYRQWSIGAQVCFRALHEYRTTDPRPRSIVTDLTAVAGLSRNVGPYVVALNVGGRFYKQTNDVAFYREAGAIPEYQFVGLGMDYKRFSGSNTSAYYKATGLVLGFDLTPHEAHKPSLSARYDYTPFKRILPKLNSMPISNLYLYRCQAQVVWPFTASWQAEASVHYERRVGDEYIAGSSSGTEYRIVSQLTMFHADNTLYSLCIKRAATLAAGRLQVRLSAGYHDFRASYHYPYRSVSLDKLQPSIEAWWKRAFHGRRQLALSLYAEGYIDLSHSMTMPYATMDEANTRFVDATFERLKASYYGAGLSGRYDMPLTRRYGMFMAASLSGLAGTPLHSFGASASVGITF